MSIYHPTEDAFILYKITNELAAISTADILPPLSLQSGHTHQWSYKLDIATTDYYKYSYFLRIVVHWNALPPDIPLFSTKEQLNTAICHIEFNHLYSAVTFSLFIFLPNVPSYKDFKHFWTDAQCLNFREESDI